MKFGIWQEDFRYSAADAARLRKHQQRLRLISCCRRHWKHDAQGGWPGGFSFGVGFFSPPWRTAESRLSGRAMIGLSFMPGIVSATNLVDETLDHLPRTIRARYVRAATSGASTAHGLGRPSCRTRSPGIRAAATQPHPGTRRRRRHPDAARWRDGLSAKWPGVAPGADRPAASGFRRKDPRRRPAGWLAPSTSSRRMRWTGRRYPHRANNRDLAVANLFIHHFES